MGFPAKLYLAWRRRFQRCAATCTEAVVERVGSKTTDLECLCSDLGSVVNKMTLCVALKGDCDFEDVHNDTDLNRNSATDSIGVRKNCNPQQERGFEDRV
ncbi:hypothetical protein FOMG_18482 [Fusarium oxysporum f. sp. melonis 26406]|uniref:CFEM domain-containing protein n=1 Tax=Fusarium oxysporum f. sp. melonis 26406 TaxID=1089452 RepID=W9ZUM7_FUSOX|nr:hypothetical protein FOMG_19675 [Fusarium oxysporum f. sp. melonis 26406]EXK24816.1 hypothetical protein FOMG_18482 [Fusarium oxysporum f. sp. melonis 26406]